MEINGCKKAVGCMAKQNLYPLWMVLMIEQKDLFANQGDWGLIEPSMEADGSIFGHPAPGAFSEVVVEPLWSQTDTLGVIGKPTQGALAG